MLYDSRKRKILYVVFMTVITFITIVFFSSKNHKVITALSDLPIENPVASSMDGCIRVTWNDIYALNLDCVQIEIKNEQGQLILLEKCNPNTKSFEFRSGNHGEAYNIRINLLLTDGNVIYGNTLRTMFLNYTKMEGVPLIEINTISGKNPSYEIVAAPNGCWGVGIKNNDYCAAEISVINDGKINYYNTAEIRVRGNTSADLTKKPYKIKMETSVNLLNLKNEKYACKEWILLPIYDLKFLVGTEIATMCGLEWQPKYEFVNFMLNGAYMGCYWLVEEIGTEPWKSNIDKSGYIIECDAYWWNNNGEYFKTENQIYQMAYTFKYPTFSSLETVRLKNIKNHLELGVSYLKNNDNRYIDYIDIDSWASWLLTHDILGTLDSGGSNMYYYKKDFIDKNPCRTKIKMGPVWDFDSSFAFEEGWSKIRHYEHGYFPWLLRQTNFTNVYEKKWQTIYDTLAQEIDNKISLFFSTNLLGMQHSLYLDGVCWQKEEINIKKQREFFKSNLVSRISWINENI